MKLIRLDGNQRLPIKSWCAEVEDEALRQALNLSNHPITVSHIALMPDCHVGFGMPIGGVIACSGGIIPNAVGVDIGCGMIAVQTDFNTGALSSGMIHDILGDIKKHVPLGEGNSHRQRQKWSGFDDYSVSVGDRQPGWMKEGNVWELAFRNLGTLGGGNHFIEMQKSVDGSLWLMIHTGSRNLGYRIASYYHEKALCSMRERNIILPDDDLAYLPVGSRFYNDYARDMLFAMNYAMENRNRIIDVFKNAVSEKLRHVNFLNQINIHHNYASLEKFFGQELWVHRKGAISAGRGVKGIIPGSMGTPSFIVEGLGSIESFNSCSHGAGRIMSRTKACEKLSVEECDKAMGDVVFDRWKTTASRFRTRTMKASYDLSESPLAYKDIIEVMSSQSDLVRPLEKLFPIGVIKG